MIEGKTFIVIFDNNNLYNTINFSRQRTRQTKTIEINFANFIFQRCGQISSKKKIDWIEIFLLVIAALIGLLSFIAAIVVCCLYSRLQSNLVQPIR
jgi:hypothetical protein